MMGTAMEVPFALTLTVELRLLPQEEGGIDSPITTGYRPVCTFFRADGEQTRVGMCQIELLDVAELGPGASGRGLLRFAPGVAEIARGAVTVGSRVDLAEGNTVVGRATVVAIE